MVLQAASMGREMAHKIHYDEEVDDVYTTLLVKKIASTWLEIA